MLQCRIGIAGRGYVRLRAARTTTHDGTTVALDCPGRRAGAARRARKCDARRARKAPLLDQMTRCTSEMTRTMEACPARLRTTGWSLSSCEYCFSFSGWPRLRRGRLRSRARSRARRQRVGCAPEIDVLHEYVALVEGELLDDAAHRGILDLVQRLVHHGVGRVLRSAHGTRCAPASGRGVGAGVGRDLDGRCPGLVGRLGERRLQRFDDVTLRHRLLPARRGWAMIARGVQGQGGGVGAAWRRAITSAVRSPRRRAP